jgi:hypothetical protein
VRILHCDPDGMPTAWVRTGRADAGKSGAGMKPPSQAVLIHSIGYRQAYNLSTFLDQASIFFRSEVIEATLKLSGTVPDMRDMLTMSLRTGARTFTQLLKMVAGSGSRLDYFTGAFLIRSEMNSSVTVTVSKCVKEERSSEVMEMSLSSC